MPTETTMTALRKAGLDTVAIELEREARDCLGRNNNDAQRALLAMVRLVEQRRDLLGALVLDYLKRLGHSPGDAHPLAAETAAAGQARSDSQNTIAGGGTNGRSTVRAHKVREYKRRTASQKTAARLAIQVAAGVYDRRIDGRPIGDVTWGELRELGRERGYNAVSYFRYGEAAAADAFLIRKLLSYAQVDDMSKRVRDVVPEDVLARLDREAFAALPRVITRTMESAHSTLVHEIESQ